VNDANPAALGNAPMGSAISIERQLSHELLIHSLVVSPYRAVVRHLNSAIRHVRFVGDAESISHSFQDKITSGKVNQLQLASPFTKIQICRQLGGI
jgi:hypothetical protein